MHDEKQKILIEKSKSMSFSIEVIWCLAFEFKESKRKVRSQREKICRLKLHHFFHAFEKIWKFKLDVHIFEISVEWKWQMPCIFHKAAIIFFHITNSGNDFFVRRFPLWMRYLLLNFVWNDKFWWISYHHTGPSELLCAFYFFWFFK